MGGPTTSSRKLLNGRRLLAALCLSALILLAGCAGKDAPAAAAIGVRATGPAQFDDESGGVEGTVLTDESLPLALVSVGIPSLGIIGETGDAGSYSLSYVPPGRHMVVASAIGFEGAMTWVEVAAGEISRGADLTLKAMASSGPFQVTLSETGFFGCGTSWRPAAVYSGISACSIIGIADEDTGQDTSSLDKFLINWTLPYPTSDWSGAVFEMRWDSTQAFGRGLRMVWEIDGCVNAEESEGLLAEASGVSPLRVWLSKDQIESILDLQDGTCTDTVGEEVAKNCGPASCNVISRVFSDSATLGSSSQADVGLTAQQAFSQHLTAFYGPPPAGAEAYTAIL